MTFDAGSRIQANMEVSLPVRPSRHRRDALVVANQSPARVPRLPRPPAQQMDSLRCNQPLLPSSDRSGEASSASLTLFNCNVVFTFYQSVKSCGGWCKKLSYFTMGYASHICHMHAEDISRAPGCTCGFHSPPRHQASYDWYLDTRQQ